MKIERTLSIMLFFCALDISVKAQSPTQNYVLSKDVLDVDGTHAITTVTYYDGLNRLEESTYAEGEDMSQNKNRYSENVLSYSANGSIERLQRYGKKNNGAFGLIDDLTYSYNGNQIKAISDKAGSLLYNGSFDFKDGANADVEYLYDANGALVKDLDKGISNIEYDVLGNLKCITFSNGFKTKYIYDAAGNKLRSTHESAVTNTIDYIGNFVLEDGTLSKYLFDGGSNQNSEKPGG